MYRAKRSDHLPRGYHVEGEAYQILTEEDLELERMADEILERKCTRCKSHTPQFGESRCEHCKENDASRRARWKEEGLCWQCGRKPSLSSNYCTKCRRTWQRHNNRREDI